VEQSLGMREQAKQIKGSGFKLEGDKDKESSKLKDLSISRRRPKKNYKEVQGGNRMSLDLGYREL